MCCVNFLRDRLAQKVFGQTSRNCRPSLGDLGFSLLGLRAIKHLMLVGRNGGLNDEYRPMNTRDDAIITDVHSFQSI